jgi:proteic killer suppression protein
MIKNFSSKIAEDIYNGINSRYSRKLPQGLHEKTCRLLDQINAVTRIETLRVLPSNHLEKLKGKLSDYWSLRINQQWRIIFQWENGEILNVDIVDYH